MNAALGRSLVARLAAPTTRILLILVLIYATFGFLSPDGVFFEVENLRTVSTSAAEILIIATGLTFLIIAGQLDLSVGSVLVLSAVVGAKVMAEIAAPGAAIAIAAVVVAAVAVGVVFGLVNGVLTTRLRVPSFIVTLGTLGVGLGIAQLMTSAGGATSEQAPQALTDFGLSRVAGIPSVVVVAAGVALAGALVLHRTRFGLHCYAVGSNRDASRRAGVRADRVVVACFVLSGALSALAGIVDLARFSSVSVGSHQSDNLTAIAAVIIGGASLYGGRGTMLGTTVGTLIPVVLLQGFVIQDVNPYWQSIAIGVVLIAAVALDQIERASSRARAEAASASGHDSEQESAASPPTTQPVIPAERSST